MHCCINAMKRIYTGDPSDALVSKGVDAQSACQMALVTPLTDDPDMRDTLAAAVNTYF